MSRSLLDDAYQISKDVISLNDGELGIYAGGTHFREYWARDSFFAILGSASTHPKLSKKTLKTFIDLQSEEGQIPLTISQVNRLLRTFGIERKRRNLFYRHDFPFGGKTQDSNLLFLIAFDEYIRKSGDKNFLMANLESVTKASDWSAQFDESDLIREGKIANWMDTLLYSGCNMYTNSLYYKSLLSMASLMQEAGMYGHGVYEEKAERVKYAVDQAFWRDRYYSRWAHNNDFTGSGNSLAMLFGISSEKKREGIVSYIESKGLSNQPVLEAEKNVPFYKRRKLPLILGMYEYAKTPWPWIGCVYSLSLRDYNEQLSNKMFTKIAQSIIDNQTTLEIVNQEGNTGRSKIYHSERDFSWTAGLYIYAYEQLANV